MSKYLIAKERMKRISGTRNISDYEIIEMLENEIEYYRNKIDKLTIVHRENVNAIQEQDELIKEYQEVLKKMLFENKDIFEIRTPNQIRKLLGYNHIDTQNNKEVEQEDNIEEITTTTVYANGNPIKTITECKYKKT